MLQRVMPELMGLKNILVLNDEAHHCYREKPSDDDEDDDLKGDDRKEAEKNNEAARLWISGLEAVNRKLGARARDRPLRDAVLPARLGLRRGHALPVDDERLLADGRHRVRHREAAARARWRRTSPATRCRCSATCGRTSARTCRRRGAARRRRSTRSPFPTRLQTALCRRSTATTRRPSSCGRRRGSRVPPCFIVVCNNTSTSKLVYDFISGFQRAERRRLHARWRTAASPSSATSTSTATRSPRPNTLLIDSEQLESGEALDDNFRGMAADEIERFRREIVERTGDRRAGREPHRPGPAPRGDEHRRQARAAWAARSAASSRSRCSPRAGTPTP